MVAKLSFSPQSLSSDSRSQLAEQQVTAGQLALEQMHDARGPLDALGHLAYLTLLEADRPDLVREYMTLASEQLGHLCRLVRDPLAYANASKQSEAIDFVALAEAALRIHQRRITVKRIRVLKRLPENLVVTMHGGQMLQVLSNLLMNALDALPDSGILHVRLRKARGYVHLTIADSGPGIPAKHLPHIFRPFYTTKGNGGTGLGLAMSKRIVEQHHGRIRLRTSVFAGRSGTVLKISLPM